MEIVLTEIPLISDSSFKIDLIVWKFSVDFLQTHPDFFV